MTDDRFSEIYKSLFDLTWAVEKLRSEVLPDSSSDEDVYIHHRVASGRLPNGLIGGEISAGEMNGKTGPKKEILKTVINYIKNDTEVFGFNAETDCFWKRTGVVKDDLCIRPLRQPPQP